MHATTFELPRLSDLFVALREAGSKIHGAAHEILAHEQPSRSWVQRVILHEIESRARTRGPAYWDARFPGLLPQARAEARIRRMLTRATAAGVAAAAGATTAELLPLVTDGLGTLAAIPLGLLSVGAELLYTTALQIDLAFDLASIYGVPFAADDAGAISILLGAALNVELGGQPVPQDRPASEGEAKTWRAFRELRRDEFSNHVGLALLENAFARNALPVVSVLISATWSQIVLRRFARQVHAAIRRRHGIVNACRELQLGDLRTARSMLDGAFLIATADGDVGHQEALALATLIDSLGPPDRIALQETRFPDDEEEWFAHVAELERELRPMLIRVLVLVGAASGAIGSPERRFLRRLARTLDCELDFAAIDRFVAQVRAGEVPQRFDQLELAPRLA